MGWLRRGVAASALAVGVVVLLLPTASTAARTAGSPIVVRPPAGYTVFPRGQFNGPLSPRLFTGLVRAQAAQRLLSSHGVFSYIRAFHRHTTNVLLVLAFVFPADAGEIPYFLYGLEGSVRGVGNAFPTPYLPGSVGTTEVGAAGATSHLVTFAKGDAVYMVEGASPHGSVTRTATVRLALDQAAITTGAYVLPHPRRAPTASLSHRLTVIFAWVIGIVFVLGLLAIALQRSRMTRLREAGPLPPPALPALEPGTPEGWYPSPANVQLLYHWDGERFTAKGSQTPQGWVEAPLEQHA